MNNDLLEQLAEYGSATRSARQPVTASSVRDRSGLIRLAEEPRTRSTGSRWYVAVAAAGVVAVLVGGVAWLSRTTVGTSADETAPSTTIAHVTTTTEPAITTDTVAATTTTIVAAPIVPPGEGPKLSFVEATPPSDGALSGGNEWWGGGEWFDGFLFVPTFYREATLLRSTDGLTWASVPGLPASGDAQDSLLQADEDRIVNLVVPRNDGPIRVNISTNGDDWLSSTIDVPIFGESNGAGVFRWVGRSNESNSVLAVGPQGIVVAASMRLEVDGERFANSLVDPDAGIHVEIIDLDLDRSVIVVAFLDEENDMEQIGDLREVDLNSTGFGRDYAKILKAMAADPDWEPAVDWIVSRFTSAGYATATVNYAWFSSDGVSWQRLPITTRTLDAGQFVSVLGIDPPNRTFADIPTTGMRITISDLGLIGTTKRSGIQAPPGKTIEVLLSIDGSSWNRWEPSEFGQRTEWAEARIVGVGDDFVVIEVREWDAGDENPSESLWVGSIP